MEMVNSLNLFEVLASIRGLLVWNLFEKSNIHFTAPVTNQRFLAPLAVHRLLACRGGGL